MRNSILFVLVVASLESGCGAKLPSVKPFKMEIQQGNVVTSKMLLQLRPGMTRSQVRYIMGTPLIVDSFRDNRWDYFYELRKEGKVIEKRRVILDFDKDSLVSVRGDVIPTAENAEIKTIVEAPPKKAEAPEQAWTDKLKFWKSEEGVVSDKPSQSTAADAVPQETKSAEASRAENVQPNQLGETNAEAGNEQEMLAQVVETVEPPSDFKQAPMENPVVAAEPELVLPPTVDAAPANAALAAPVAEGLEEEVVPYIPEGEYVAPLIPTEEDMIKGNMAEANAPSKEAEARQVTEKGVAPQSDAAAEPSPTFVAEQLPEPEPEPELPLPPPTVHKPVVQEIAPAAALATTEAQVDNSMVMPQSPVAPEAAPVSDAEINQAVATWAQAWRSKDVKKYLAAYAPDFVPEGMVSRVAWEAQRKQRLSAGQGKITLVLNDVRIEREGSAATVQFEQKYAAKTYKDELVKTLDMRYEPALKRWLITREHVAGSSAAASAAPTKVDMVESVSPTTQTSTNQALAPEKSVEASIDDWAQAWRSKDINQYFAAYSSEFVPEGLPSKRAWEAQRKKRLSPQQGKISLDIANIKVTRDGDSAVATFTQKYASKAYRDEVVKRLQLSRDTASGRWLIVRESTASDADMSANKQQVTAPEDSAEHLDGILEQIGF